MLKIEVIIMGLNVLPNPSQEDLNRLNQFWVGDYGKCSPVKEEWREAQQDLLQGVDWETTRKKTLLEKAREFIANC